MPTMWRAILILTIVSLVFPVLAVAEEKNPQLLMQKANQVIIDARSALENNQLAQVNELLHEFHEQWEHIESAIKQQSKQAYVDIEEHYETVKSLLKQEPVDTQSLGQVLVDLQNTNESFIQGKYSSGQSTSSAAQPTISDLVLSLQQIKSAISDGQYAKALTKMDEFSMLWVDTEGAVLVQSAEVYEAMERDIVAVKSYLKSSEPSQDDILSVVEQMIVSLTPLASKTSYTMMDAMTIILREGMEVLLIAMALLTFLERSGHRDKKNWIYGGIGIGLAVSIVIGVIVQLLFTSGRFGNNQFLVHGFTGVFAAIMLLYMSFWLHSKSNLQTWQAYIKNQGMKALATGSLFSLGLLAFLSVLREGIEVVLFFIGMASAIALSNLLIGVALGISILAVITVGVLKLSVRIPVRPFFFISSILVFYLGLKFVGTGINSLQIAGVIPATISPSLPSISWLGTFPSWQVVIPQLAMVLCAVVFLFVDYRQHRASAPHKTSETSAK